MIDVNIVEQLVPNPITMVVQLCSTLILFLAMKHFLWPSVKAFLDARAQKMQSDLEESEQAKQAALSDRAMAKETLAKASMEGEEILKTFQSQARSEKEEILRRANQEAAMIKEKAHEQMEAEKEQMYRSMQKEMIDVAMAVANALLMEKADKESDKAAIEAFVKKTVNHD